MALEEGLVSIASSVPLPPMVRLMYCRGIPYWDSYKCRIPAGKDQTKTGIRETGSLCCLPGVQNTGQELVWW
jgi:hypothetical protein